MKLVRIGLTLALAVLPFGGSAGAQEISGQALPEFAKTVDEYAALHASLINEVGGLTLTDKPAEISSASDRLAAAIQRARPRARQGDFFTPSVRAVLLQRLASALGGQDIRAMLDADKEDERSNLRFMRTYSRFPTDGPLATMPPSVLHVLPPLPEFLEYRFVGNDLILRDRDARLVLDWIKGAVAVK